MEDCFQTRFLVEVECSGVEHVAVVVAAVVVVVATVEVVAAVVVGVVVLCLIEAIRQSVQVASFAVTSPLSAGSKFYHC